MSLPVYDQSWVSLDNTTRLTEVLNYDQSNEFEQPLLVNSCYLDNDSLGNVIKRNDGKFLSILNTNARSLVKNITEFQAFTDSLISSHKFKFDILTFTETWANTQLEDLLVFNTFNPVFKHKINKKEGGGIAVFIQQDLKFNIRNDILFPVEKQHQYDCLFIEVHSESNKEKNTILGVIYRSPNFNNITEFTENLKLLIEQINDENKNIVIAGDLNIDLLKAGKNVNSSHLLDMMISNNLIPHITLPTRVTHSTATLIDHVYSNVSHDRSFSATMTTNITDHFTNFIFLDINAKASRANKVKHITYRVSSNTAFDDFNNALEQEDFSEIYATNDPSESYSLFMQKLLDLRNEHMPIVTKQFNKYKHKLSPWITKGILISLRTKDKMHSKLCRTKNPETRQRQELAYKTYIRIYKKVLHSAKKTYWHNKFQECKNDIKNTWNTINSVLQRKNNKHDFTTHFLVRNCRTDNHELIAQEFNNYYASVGRKLSENIQNSRHDVRKFLPKLNMTRSFFLEPTTNEEIISIINLIKPKTSYGFDNISSKFMKSCSKQAIASPLSHIINSSFLKGAVPSEMKISKVIPIFKNGNKEVCKNYRPVALLPVFSKIIERLVYNRLFRYFTKHKLLSQSQYGFQKNLSTELAILEMQDRIVEALSNKQ